MTERVREGACQVLLAGALEPAALPADLEASVQAVWTVERSRRPALFNGPLLSFLDADGDKIRVERTEYRRYLAQRHRPELREHLRVRPMAVSGLVVTSDGHALLGRRGASVTQYPLHFEAVPSGSLDERAFAANLPAIGLTLDPLLTLMAELTEESGIDREAVADVRPLGLFFDDEGDNYDLGYLLRLRLPSRAVRDLVATHGASEYESLEVLEPEAMQAALEGSKVVPLTRMLWATVDP